MKVKVDDYNLVYEQFTLQKILNHHTFLYQNADNNQKQFYFCEVFDYNQYVENCHQIVKQINQNKTIKEDYGVVWLKRQRSGDFVSQQIDSYMNLNSEYVPDLIIMEKLNEQTQLHYMIYNISHVPAKKSAEGFMDTEEMDKLVNKLEFRHQNKSGQIRPLKHGTYSIILESQGQVICEKLEMYMLGETMLSICITISFLAITTHLFSVSRFSVYITHKLVPLLLMLKSVLTTLTAAEYGLCTSLSNGLNLQIDQTLSTLVTIFNTLLNSYILSQVMGFKYLRENLEPMQTKQLFMLTISAYFVFSLQNIQMIFDRMSILGAVVTLAFYRHMIKIVFFNKQNTERQINNYLTLTSLSPTNPNYEILMIKSRQARNESIIAVLFFMLKFMLVIDGLAKLNQKDDRVYKAYKQLGVDILDYLALFFTYWNLKPLRNDARFEISDVFINILITLCRMPEIWDQNQQAQRDWQRIINVRFLQLILKVMNHLLGI
ncbi:UNKNOWN [Stylonychia lemnae]|uniref:Uncharacterized protein n=1 Tax=Stylonychia lemnae TaxID=5949 RepID=A0A078B5K9_STYLE|nr:UNKNOWN [Stylonychia lemnae]|eukprot:CDW89810.1 UNKNOWN [Stylonychia lemnae]